MRSKLTIEPKLTRYIHHEFITVDRGAQNRTQHRRRRGRPRRLPHLRQRPKPLQHGIRPQGDHQRGEREHRLGPRPASGGARGGLQRDQEEAGEVRQRPGRRDRREPRPHLRRGGEEQAGRASRLRQIQVSHF